jgi:hypothetical protein
MFLDILNFSEPVSSFHCNELEQMLLASGVGKRLLVACLLGGSFSELGTLGQHKALMATLRASPVIGQLLTYHAAEGE